MVCVAGVYFLLIDKKINNNYNNGQNIHNNIKMDVTLWFKK